MEWSRKGVLLLLAVVVSWTALPASACLLAMQPARHAACCHGMAKMCGSAGMGTQAACCRANPHNPTFAPVAPYASEHSQPSASLINQIDFLGLVVRHLGNWNDLEAPPPHLSPGGSSILRI